jgi:hypothetical protein
MGWKTGGRGAFSGTAGSGGAAGPGVASSPRMKNSVMASGSSGPVGRPVRQFTLAAKTPSGMGAVTGGTSHCPSHEIRPDRRCQPSGALVGPQGPRLVKAGPQPRHQPGRISYKPDVGSVLAGPGLGRHTAPGNLRPLGGPALDRALQEARDEKRHLLADHALTRLVARLQDVSVGWTTRRTPLGGTRIPVRQDSVGGQAPASSPRTWGPAHTPAAART